ncbi:UDP-N-acetylglucosamine transporter UGNT1-like isoform X1 [Benincasa hispida]|uniref:UDP-N-acetylglucosamine transporter UGNT1-like isoform X1 n=1 Tax=Benincasa hispida TaxID=102211 RepID=UPI00190083F2|nr:UDP-N-acetylglucosamine transporter UGNT1-like isoform X1 [Benincasa hispida]
MASERSTETTKTLLPVLQKQGEEDDDHGRSKAGSAMSKTGAYAAISYMASAVLLLMFNKAALSSYKFPCANVITLFQIICSSTLLYALRHWKIISFTVGESQSISSSGKSIILIPYKTLVQTLPLALSYLLYMLVTMESVRGINVPMYTTLRRTTVAFTMIAEYLLAGQTHSPFVVGSVGMIILGAVVAGARDLSFDIYSYAVVFIANLCTAIYLASIARIGLICGPFLLFWIILRGDIDTTLNFPDLFSFGFQCVMILSCIMAFLINYFVFLNTTLNSALTQTVCGNLKDVFSIAIGWFLFGGLPYDFLNVVGQSLGFLGSCLYAYCKLHGK